MTRRFRQDFKNLQNSKKIRKIINFNSQSQNFHEALKKKKHTSYFERFLNS